MQLRRAPQHAESLPGSLGRSDVRYGALRSDHVELVRPLPSRAKPWGKLRLQASPVLAREGRAHPYGIATYVQAEVERLSRGRGVAHDLRPTGSNSDRGSLTESVTIAPVAEPATRTMVLLGVGAAGYALRRLKDQRAARRA